MEIPSGFPGEEFLCPIVPLALVLEQDKQRHKLCHRLAPIFGRSPTHPGSPLDPLLAALGGLGALARGCPGGCQQEAGIQWEGSQVRAAELLCN